MGGLGKAIRRALGDRPVGLWLLLFLFMNLAFDLGGGTNASSRYASLAALAEDGSFSINPYLAWTSDWSRTPDGTYYSNKAPGPVLLGFPVYKVVDSVVNWGVESREARDANRRKIKFVVLKGLSLLLQVIPFFAFTCGFAVWFRQQGLSPGARHVGILLIAMGTTATLFLNSFFGHGVAAVGLLGMALAWVRKQPLGVGLGLGLAALSDYGTLAVGVGLLFALWGRRDRWGVGEWMLIVAGALVPLGVGALYHWVCFGGPLKLPLSFQNPEFVDTPGGWMGVVGLPRWRALVELSVGGSRGLLWTNPWIVPLAVGVALLGRRHTPWADPLSEPRDGMARIAFIGLTLLWLLNSAFGAWHGGHTVGPRYLSAVLPLFGVVAALCYDRFSAPLRAGLWAGVALSCLFNLLVFLSNEVPAPGVALWPYYLRSLFFDPSLTAVLRTACLLVGGAICMAVVSRTWRKSDLTREF